MKRSCSMVLFIILARLVRFRTIMPKMKLSHGDTPYVRARCTWILLAVALTCCVPGVVLAQVFGTNLIVKGNAESGLGSTDGDTPPHPNAPGWTVTGSFLVVRYDVSSDYLLSTDPGSPTRAKNFFAGGVTSSTSKASQSIDVSAGAAAIDTNHVGYTLSGWLGGWSGQDDNAKLTITFRNASATTVISCLGVLIAQPQSARHRSALLWQPIELTLAACCSAATRERFLLEREPSMLCSR